MSAMTTLGSHPARFSDQLANALILSLVFALLPLPSASYAQAAGSNEDETANTNLSAEETEEVVVTAQKREQILLNVPISLAVFTSETLEKNGVTELGNLQNLVPNFQISDNVSVRTVYVRGVGGGGRTVAFDTRAGIYLDGVYVGQPMAVDAVLVNLDRVEILRGPQGYLYGQNSDAGAVNLVTRPPSNELEAKGIASYGNKNETKLVSMLNVPLVNNKALLRVGASYYGRDGFINNVTLNDDVDDKKNYSTRAQLRIKANEDLTIDLSADYSSQLSDNVNGEARSDTFNTPGGRPTPPADQPYVTDDNFPERDYNRNWGLAMTGNYNLGDLSVTSITGYRNSFRNWNVDLDHGSYDLANFFYYDTYKTFSQELRLNGMGGHFTYVAGLFYMKTEAENDRYLVLGSLAPLIGGTPSSTARLHPTVDNSTYAIFGALDYEFATGWTANLGARVNYETKELTLFQNSTINPAIVDIAIVSGLGRELSEGSFSPSIGVTWKPDADTTIYAKYSRAVKSGGFNADLLKPSQILGDLKLGKETVDDFEIGTKFRTVDRNITFSGNVFFAKYSDYQVSQFRIIPGSTPPIIELALTNAGEVVTYGPEAAMTWAPLAELTIDLSGAWLHAEYSEFKDGGGVGVDYSGNRLEYAPRWTASATVDYTHHFQNDSAGFALITVAYHGDQFSDSSNAAQFYQKPYTLVNARIGWYAPGETWGVTLYANNLLDEFYDLGTSPDGFTTIFGRYGDPRTYGIEVSWRM